MYQSLMPPKTPLTDNEAHSLLTETRMMLAQSKGRTVRAETAIRAADKALLLLSLGLLMAAEQNSDDNLAIIKDRTEP
jgi:hypothetical protein